MEHVLMHERRPFSLQSKKKSYSWMVTLSKHVILYSYVSQNVFFIRDIFLGIFTCPQIQFEVWFQLSLELPKDIIICLWVYKCF